MVFCGRRGGLWQRYREGQEHQLHALELVMNAIIVWNTMYIERAIEHLHRASEPVADATSPGSRRSATLISTCWAATASC